MKGQPVERDSSVLVPLFPGFDFKVVPETRSLKEGEDANFQATITNTSNAKLSYSLVVRALGDVNVAAFNGGQSDEYRKAGMVPQQTDQVDIVIRPGPDVKGPFAVKLVGPEYHDKDDRVLPCTARRSCSRRSSGRQVPAVPIISSIGDYDLFSLGSAVEAYPFVDLASFVSTTQVSILLGARNENSPSGHAEIRVLNSALNNFDPPNPAKIYEGWSYISIGKIESASGSLRVHRGYRLRTAERKPSLHRLRRIAKRQREGCIANIQVRLSTERLVYLSPLFGLQCRLETRNLRPALESDVEAYCVH